MSKKIAGGAKNIVLDVKVGSGAFMKREEDALSLAENMVKIGKGCDRNVCALITDMDTPLGTHIGNSLEVLEAIGVLKGECKDDLYDICVALSTEMVALGLNLSSEKAKEKVIESIESGKAFEKMREWIAFQGGDVNQIDNPEKLPRAKYSYEIKSSQQGFIRKMDAESIGISALILGAGRENKEDSIDFGAGIVLCKKTGDAVKKGESLCTLYSNNKDSFLSAEQRFISAIEISDVKPEKNKLIYKIIK